jgi:hypothetical protein
MLQLLPIVLAVHKSAISKQQSSCAIAVAVSHIWPGPCASSGQYQLLCNKQKRLRRHQPFPDLSTLLTIWMRARVGEKGTGITQATIQDRAKQEGHRGMADLRPNEGIHHTNTKRVKAQQSWDGPRAQTNPLLPWARSQVLLFGCNWHHNSQGESRTQKTGASKSHPRYDFAGKNFECSSQQRHYDTEKYTLDNRTTRLKWKYHQTNHGKRGRGTILMMNFQMWTW